MDIESIRSYCLSKKGVSESFPFNDTTLVFKVKNKIFCLLSLNPESVKISLKCDPERAIGLREEYEDIQPGYHLNKRLWNTVSNVETSFSSEFIADLIDHSYELIVASLPKKMQTELAQN
jgi:predicted DNA-binding protein (MmcQ/YjbR family)